MSLIEYGWTREETPEAVIYTKPDRRPIVYDRREMGERALEMWSEDGASERHSAFMTKSASARWAVPGARQRQREIKRAWWAARKAIRTAAE